MLKEDKPKMIMLLLNRRSSSSSNVKSLKKARKWYKSMVLSSRNKSDNNLNNNNENFIKDEKHQRTLKKSETLIESSIELRNRAYEICRKYLSGEWNKISSEDMIFKTVSGGLSNLLYYCSLPSTHTPVTGEPHQVLLRMYGQLLDKNDTKIIDSVITMLLSERKLGPKLYGIFPDGRLEEYIPARAMMCNELSDPIYSTIIARKLAVVHYLNVPIKKEPTWLSDTMNKWLKFVRQSSASVSPKTMSKIEEKLIKFNFEKEIEEMFRLIEKNCQSPVVFCHNDLQEGNILLPTSNDNDKKQLINNNNDGDDGKIINNNFDEDHIVFIDFEFCSYNYRGFDIANHFIERIFDYSIDEWPHFSTDYSNYPSDAEKLLFIREYLRQNNELKQHQQQSSELDTEENLLKEIDFYALASHLLWTLWSIKNSRTSVISFGYLEYGEKRLEAYHLHKKYLMDKYHL